MTTTTTKSTKRPSHAVYVVQGDGEASRWVRIGAAWPNKDGNGFSMQLDAAPILGRIVMRAAKDQVEDQGALV